MVPPEKKSIRNIPVSAVHRRRAALEQESEEIAMEDAAAMRVRPAMRRGGRKGKRLFVISALAVVVVCAIGGLLLSTLFAGATITVYPKQQQVVPPATLLAMSNPTTGELGYQLLTATRSATTTVAASGTKQVSRSASGVITIYNASGTTPQRLIANTRFAAPDGKIYRIHDSITVPGSAKASDGSITPGSATITVYADSPGDSYNRGATQFTIPGFKGDPKYTTMYATADAITGGFVGPEPAVAAADLSKAGDALKQSLSQAAQSALTSEIPAGFIAVPGTLVVTFSDIVQSPADANSAALSQSATMSGAVVSAGDLASAIARSAVDSYKGEAVAFADMSQISIAAATSTKPGENISLAIAGTPTLVWQYDPAALKAALLSKNKTDFQSIIESFAPAIARADAKVRPFWQSAFPGDPNKIDIVAGSH